MNNNYPTLTVLVGIPGCGKSTWSKKMVDENTIRLSSDDLREQINGDINCQENHGFIFNEMNRLTKMYLKQGKNVIYDATNLNSKKRKGLLGQFRKMNINKVCKVFYAPLLNCFINNRNRERVLEDYVIKNKLEQFQTPMYYEGWDRIEIVNNYIERHDTGMMNLNGINSYKDFVDKILFNDFELSKCIDLAQDSSYHTFSVSRHMYYAYDWIKDKTDNEHLKLATLLHDIGKPWCKQFIGNSKYASYRNHENVGAYFVIGYLLWNTKMTDDEILKVSGYITLHTRLMQKELNLDKLRESIGNDVYQELVLLYNADTQAK